VTSWAPIDLISLTDRPPVQPTLAGIVYPAGTRHLFSGEPESCKTIAAFALGLEEIRAGGRVLHLDFEMFAHRTRERLREMGATDQELTAWVHVEPDAPPTPEDIAALLALTPTLAIVDAAAGAYAALGLDDNKRADVENYARLLVDPLARAHVSSITLDHVTKSRENRGRFAIGSERKVGGCDVHLSFAAIKPFHRGGDGLVLNTVAKDRFGYLPRPNACDLELHSHPDTHEITWEFKAAAAETAGSWRPTILMDRVTDHLRQQTEPVSRKAITDAVPGNRQYLLQAIDFLILEGTANERKGSRGAKLVALTDLFPVPDVFPEHVGTLERNDVFRVPSSTGGTSHRNKSQNGTAP
jgi:hypothetical protein